VLQVSSSTRVYVVRGTNRLCVSGTMGLKGNLRASEIVEQLVYANMHDKVRNVVFMG